MRTNVITIRHRVVVLRPREVVWDYTQNFEHRHSWDPAVIGATTLQTEPGRVVRIKGRGNTMMTFHYKHDERPYKTSLSATEVTSPFIETAGGSWVYLKLGKATIWKQTNTIVLKKNIWNPILWPLYKWMLKTQMKRAMKNAKRAIEKM